MKSVILISLWFAISIALSACTIDLPTILPEVTELFVTTNVESTIRVSDAQGYVVDEHNTDSLQAVFVLEDGVYLVEAFADGYFAQSTRISVPEQERVAFVLKEDRFDGLEFGIAALSDFLIGPAPLWDRDRYTERLVTDLIVLSRGARLNNLRQGSVDAPVRWDPLDEQVDLLESENKKIKIHYLWLGRDRVLPPDFYDLDAPARRTWMLDHARMITERYKGRIAMYDVVNHPIRVGQESDYLGMGITMVEAFELLFKQTRSIDPDAILVINEGGIIVDQNYAGKDDDYYELIETLLERDTPIDCIGFMTHARDGVFDEERAGEVLDRFSTLGVPLCITEFDVWQWGPETEEPYDPMSDWWEEQGALYESAYALFTRHPAVASVVTWELSDGFTWRPGAALLTYNDPRLDVINDTFVRRLTTQKTVDIAFTPGDSPTRAVLYEEGGYGRGLSIYLDSGMVHAYLWNDNPEGPTFEPLHLEAPLNDARAVKLVHDATGLTQLFLDGTSVASGSASGIYGRAGVTIGGARNTRFHDGAFGGWGSHFVGVLDSVVVWNSLDTEEQPVLELTFDDLEGVTCAQCPRLEDGYALFEDHRHVPKPSYESFAQYAQRSS